MHLWGPRGKRLGYIITKRGIEANPNKISAIAELGQVRNVKDVKRLLRCLTTLSHFVSRLGEHGLPLYKLIKKALDDLKALISKPLVLASLEPGETLLLYVVATPPVISATLVVEREEPGHVYKIQ
jgi:hypothetical protein